MFTEMIPIGTKVKFANNIDGVVVACTIRAMGRIYNVVWWDGRSRRCEWLEEIELEIIT